MPKLLGCWFFYYILKSFEISVIGRQRERREGQANYDSFVWMREELGDGEFSADIREVKIKATEERISK